jgi:serine protease
MIQRKALGAVAIILALAFAVSVSLDSNSPAAAQENADAQIVDSGLASPQDGAAANSITALLKPNATPAAVESLATGLGGQLVRQHTLSNLQVYSFPDGAAASHAMDALSHSPLIEAVSPTRIATVFETPNDTNYAYQWDMQDTAGGVRVEPAWDLATNRGSGVVVAVIDTGVAYEDYTRPETVGLPQMAFQQAPDLAGLSVTTPWSYYFDDAHANDDNGHGSHVTGTIAQATNNAYGVVGLASNVTIMPIKVLDYTGAGMDADLVDAIYYAVDNGADVISMSLGFTGTGSPDTNGDYCTEILGLNDALDYAYANDVVVVAASGNESATVSCPAAYPTVIAVGASTYAAAVASYSNQGDALDVVAPGGDPNADLNGDGFSDGVLQETYCNDGGWIILLAILSGSPAQFDSFCDVFMSGTSMATPHVTGIAALILGEDPSLSADDVRAIIEGTARDGGPAGWDPAFGYGIVDAAAAAAAATGAPTPTPTASPSPTPSPTATSTATSTPTATATAPPGSEDTVTIAKVSYNKGRHQLKVEATSSASPTAVLTAYDNTDPSAPQLLGVLSYNNKRDRYSGSFVLPAEPGEVLVVSSEGGQDSYSFGP